MMYYLQIIFLGLCVGMPAWHAHLIHMNRPIKHGWWTLLYFAIAAIGLPFIPPVKPLLHIHFWGLDFNLPWQYICMATLIREIVYSPVLNYFRHYNFFYITTARKSYWDNMEGRYAKVIYFTSCGLLVALQFFLHK